MKLLILLLALCPLYAAEQPKPESTRQEQRQEQYWVTSSTRKIHNKSCRWYQNSKGFLTPNPQGVNCKICGGKP